MSEFVIRPAQPSDFETILTLNLAAIKATAPLNHDQLIALHAWSNYHKVVVKGELVIAFLLVLPARKSYQSLNYRWFDQRYDNFYYVDRIVVMEDYIGCQLGSLLYQDLFLTAQQQHIKYITCEYNIQPMNMTSHRFHQKQGFKEVATQWLDNNRKQVSLQVAEIIGMKGYEI